MSHVEVDKIMNTDDHVKINVTGHMFSLEYCSLVWSPSKTGLITKLESVRRRFAKNSFGHVFFFLFWTFPLIKIRFFYSWFNVVF